MKTRKSTLTEARAYRGCNVAKIGRTFVCLRCRDRWTPKPGAHNPWLCPNGCNRDAEPPKVLAGAA